MKLKQELEKAKEEAKQPKVDTSTDGLIAKSYEKIHLETCTFHDTNKFTHLDTRI